MRRRRETPLQEEEGPPIFPERPCDIRVAARNPATATGGAAPPDSRPLSGEGNHIIDGERELERKSRDPAGYEKNSSQSCKGSRHRRCPLEHLHEQEHDYDRWQTTRKRKSTPVGKRDARKPACQTPDVRISVFTARRSRSTAATRLPTSNARYGRRKTMTILYTRRSRWKCFS